MKPRIYLKHSFIDCGWRYEQWACVFDYVPDTMLAFYRITGLGATPKAAYNDWARQVGK